MSMWHFAPMGVWDFGDINYEPSLIHGAFEDKKYVYVGGVGAGMIYNCFAFYYHSFLSCFLISLAYARIQSSSFKNILHMF